MDKKGMQTISCSVQSCKHYKNDMCSLTSIKVAPCGNANTGMPEDETLCSNYYRVRAD